MDLAFYISGGPGLSSKGLTHEPSLNTKNVNIKIIQYTKLHVFVCCQFCLLCDNIGKKGFRRILLGFSRTFMYLFCFFCKSSTSNRDNYKKDKTNFIKNQIFTSSKHMWSVLYIVCVEYKLHRV